MLNIKTDALLDDLVQHTESTFVPVNYFCRGATPLSDFEDTPRQNLDQCLFYFYFIKKPNISTGLYKLTLINDFSPYDYVPWSCLLF